MRCSLGCAVFTALALTACTNHKKKMEERVEKREKAKDAFEKKEEDKRKAAIPKIEPAHLEPFWDDPAYLKVTSGRPCPEGVWTLFSTAPGEDAEKAENEKKRPDLLAKVKDATYVVVLNVDTGVKVLPYNEKKKSLPVQIEGLVECTDGVGMVSMAWGEPAKVKRPTKDEAEESTPQSVWRAKPISFSVPFDSQAEASAFVEGPGAGLQVRLVYKSKKVQEDKHLVKTELGKIDYGAGRLMHVDLIGARLSTEHEKTEVATKKYKE
jgi:hypothetical protein